MPRNGFAGTVDVESGACPFELQATGCELAAITGTAAAHAQMQQRANGSLARVSQLVDWACCFVLVARQQEYVPLK